MIDNTFLPDAMLAMLIFYAGYLFGKFTRP
jgi:hypothetical protein